MRTKNPHPIHVPPFPQPVVAILVLPNVIHAYLNPKLIKRTPCKFLPKYLKIVMRPVPITQKPKPKRKRRPTIKKIKVIEPLK